MIIYEENGNVCSCTLMSSVPEGITGYEIEAPADKEFRDAWIIDAGRLDIDLDEAKAIKVKEAKQEAADMMKAITDNYDDAEIATWDIQEAEARGNAPDSYLLELVTHSGETLANLKASIIDKANAYRSLSAESIGRRKKKVAACMAASTVDELKAVAF